ncbi:MAG: HAD-IA family hydrolase [Patescibacteria group bacterium]
MIEKYRHISFDLDGTLIHTVASYRHALVPRVVAEIGGKIKEPRSIDKFWFEPNRDKIIVNDFHIADPGKFWDLFRKLDVPVERYKHTSAYADAESAIRKLKEMGKIISIITGAPHEIAQMEIARLNGAPHDYYFSITDNKYNAKPDPRSLNFVMTELGVGRDDTVYIGNSTEDARFAKNAGVDFIFLERKEHDFDLKDYVLNTIHSLDQLFVK